MNYRLALSFSISWFAVTASAAAQQPATTGPAAVQEWNRFRGPNGTGLAQVDDLPRAFDEQNTLWRTEIAGVGHSSPALSGDRLFATTEVGDQLATFCLDRHSGALLWWRTAERAHRTQPDARNNGASPTPAVDGERVVVFFPDFGMLAYDHTGQELWRGPLGPFRNEYGMGASPILAHTRTGALAILACDQNLNSFVVALDAATGEERWRTARPHAASGHCTPVLYPDTETPTHLILPGSFSLDTYDLRTGARTAWVEGLCFEMKSVPVLHDGTVYINGYGSPLNQPGRQVEVPDFDEVLAERDGDGSKTIGKDEMVEGRARMFFGFCDRDGSGALDRDDWTFLQASLRSQNGMLAIRAGGEGDVTATHTLWAYRRSVPQLPSPLLYGEALYMLSDQGGLLVTLDPATGEPLTRGRLAEAVDNYYASPVGGDGVIYTVSQTGILTVLPATGRAAGEPFEPLHTHAMGEEVFATPALAPGRLYVRTTAAVYCFGQK